MKDRVHESPELVGGMEICVPYPFILDDFEGFDEDGPYKTKTWRPGVRFEQVSIDESESVADDEGVMILTVVSTHKPGRFPERVFYTRRWRNPKGAEFGKGKLFIATAQKFRRISRGYGYAYSVLRQ